MLRIAGWGLHILAFGSKVCTVFWTKPPIIAHYRQKCSSEGAESSKSLLFACALSVLIESPASLLAPPPAPHVKSRSIFCRKLFPYECGVFSYSICQELSDPHFCRPCDHLAQSWHVTSKKSSHMSIYRSVNSKS